MSSTSFDTDSQRTGSPGMNVYPKKTQRNRWKHRMLIFLLLVECKPDFLKSPIDWKKKSLSDFLLREHPFNIENSYGCTWFMPTFTPDVCSKRKKVKRKVVIVTRLIIIKSTSLFSQPECSDVDINIDKSWIPWMWFLKYIENDLDLLINRPLNKHRSTNITGEKMRIQTISFTISKQCAATCRFKDNETTYIRFNWTGTVIEPSHSAFFKVAKREDTSYVFLNINGLTKSPFVKLTKSQAAKLCKALLHHQTKSVQGNRCIEATRIKKNDVMVTSKANCFTVTRIIGISKGGRPLLPSPYSHRPRPLLATPSQSQREYHSSYNQSQRRYNSKNLIQQFQKFNRIQTKTSFPKNSRPQYKPQERKTKVPLKQTDALILTEPYISIFIISMLLYILIQDQQILNIKHRLLEVQVIQAPDLNIKPVRRHCRKPHKKTDLPSFTFNAPLPHPKQTTDMFGIPNQAPWPQPTKTTDVTGIPNQASLLQPTQTTDVIGIPYQTSLPQPTQTTDVIGIPYQTSLPQPTKTTDMLGISNQAPWPQPTQTTEVIGIPYQVPLPQPTRKNAFPELAHQQYFPNPKHKNVVATSVQRLSSPLQIMHPQDLTNNQTVPHIKQPARPLTRKQNRSTQQLNQNMETPYQSRQKKLNPRRGVVSDVLKNSWKNVKQLPSDTCGHTTVKYYKTPQYEKCHGHPSGTVSVVIHNYYYNTTNQDVKVDSRNCVLDGIINVSKNISQ